MNPRLAREPRMQSISLMAHFPHIKFDVKFNHIYCAYVPARQGMGWRAGDKYAGMAVGSIFSISIIMISFLLHLYPFFTSHQRFREQTEESKAMQNESNWFRKVLPRFSASHISSILRNEISIESSIWVRFLSVGGWKTDHLVVRDVKYLRAQRTNWFSRFT